jgi:hypothetical protein
LRSDGSNSPSRSISDFLLVNCKQLELTIIGAGYLRFNGVDIVRHVDQSSDMNGKLAEDRADDVHVENVRLRPLFGQPFHGLKRELAQARRNMSHDVNLPWLGKSKGSKHSSACR